MARVEDGDRWSNGPRARVRRVLVPPELYTNVQAAQHYGCSVHAIEQQIKSGTLRTRVHGIRRFVEVLTPNMQRRFDRWIEAAQACARGERGEGVVDGNCRGRWHRVVRISTDKGVAWVDPSGYDAIDALGGASSGG